MSKRRDSAAACRSDSACSSSLPSLSWDQLVLSSSILVNGPQHGLILQGGVKTGLIPGVVLSVFALFGLFGLLGAIKSDIETTALKNLHNKAWGKPWPHQSYGSIEKAEIIDDEGGNKDGDKDGPLADILHVPVSFDYHCFKEMQGLTDFSKQQCQIGSVLIIRKEYERLHNALENGYPKTRCFVVTGHPGIGKTTFLFYLLVRRLEHQLPMAIQLTAEDYIIFDKQGATVHPVDANDQ